MFIFRGDGRYIDRSHKIYFAHELSQKRRHFYELSVNISKDKTIISEENIERIFKDKGKGFYVKGSTPIKYEFYNNHKTLVEAVVRNSFFVLYEEVKE